MKKYLFLSIVGFLTGFIGLYVGIQFFQVDFSKTIEPSIVATNYLSEQGDSTPITISENRTQSGSLADRPDFVLASEISTSSVVFITTMSEYEYSTGTMFDWFFEPRTSQQISSGSGVIMSEDGYIITNNHVIDDADEIKVTQGKSSYSAKLIGVDPSSDLAVIKIDAENLSKIPMGSSAEIKVGEWVLAVGNPFNLTSTVTAGIVSAKGRNINLLRDKFPIESFIQTDAAINPGNSGGALVNQHGELIGINTAILSRTGSYAGYGFAVPVDIVKKVFTDLIKFGEVQKAFIGIDFIDIDSDIAKELDLIDLDGIIVDNIQSDGAADKANIKSGDVLKAINGSVIKNKSDAEEYLANLYPGDEINIEILRGDQLIAKNLILLNRDGETGVIKKMIYHSDFLEADFEVVSKVELDLLQIDNGIKVVNYSGRGYFAGFELPKGFVITAINRRSIDSSEELDGILSHIKGRVEIYGVDTSGRKVRYPFYLR